jgi:hypothetical protein
VHCCCVSVNEQVRVSTMLSDWCRWGQTSSQGLPDLADWGPWARRAEGPRRRVVERRESPTRRPARRAVLTATNLS